MNNNKFLYEVAKDLYNKFGQTNELSKLTIVAPSRRTRLFLNRYFAELSGDKPLWAPLYASTISLFKDMSKLKLYDEQIQKITLIWELYCAYSKVLKTARNNEEAEEQEIESFDDFYFFGEILLNDFNDIDRELAPAEKIYLNISDLKRLESWSFLNNEQLEIIQRFFNINPDSRLQVNFEKIWKILAEVYAVFKQHLELKGIAYEGMIMRDVINRLSDGSVMQEEETESATDDRLYIFVGFNYLSKCEQKLLDSLKHKSLFYWDFDDYYFNSEAGLYISDNLKKYPNELTISVHRHFEQEKNIEFVEAVNAVAQVGYIPHFLSKISNNFNFDEADTAIVLCDEKILPAVLSQIPEKIEPNIAILYSLMQSQVATLLLLLLDLQIKGVRNGRFDIVYLQPLLRNSLIQGIYPKALDDDTSIRKTNRFSFEPSSTLKIETESGIEINTILTDSQLFKTTRTPAETLIYLLETVKRIGENRILSNTMEIAALSEAYKMLNSLESIVQILGSKVILQKLIHRLLLSTKISFSGEPAKGLQIMAMSDTRNMDFRNLLVISADDGILPKKEPEASFIPPFMRRFFGLPTISDNDAQTAYTFYRLLQRAENISLMYSTGKNAIGKGEMSRYLLQLQWESPLKNKITKRSLDISISNTSCNDNFTVLKTADMLNRLKHNFNGDIYFDRIENIEKQKVLSPSAFNTYIDCPRQFYFKYVAGIKTQDEQTKLNSTTLGTIFHRAMELIYSNSIKQIIEISFFNKYLESNKLTALSLSLIERSFEEKYFRTPTQKKDYSGEQCLYFNVISRMVRNTLIYDRSQSPFQIIDLEKWCSMSISLNDGTKIYSGGIIDRIDCKDGFVRVVDYKTGKTPQDDDYESKIEGIFREGRKKKAGYQFQTFLYSSILRKKAYENVSPALIFPLVADKADYDPRLPEIPGDFDCALQSKLEELFDVNIGFEQCRKEETCKYCSYATICGRQEVDMN